jgi:hypothetical protein
MGAAFCAFDVHDRWIPSRTIELHTAPKNFNSTPEYVSLPQIANKPNPKKPYERDIAFSWSYTEAIF